MRGGCQLRSLSMSIIKTWRGKSLFLRKLLWASLSLSLLLIAKEANSDPPNPNYAQSQIELASAQFDAFTLKMPVVIKNKIEAFLKRGFRAILLDDSATKPAEEEMVKSLTDGLRHMGAAFEDDMINFDILPALKDGDS